MIAVWNPHVIHVKGELPALSKVQHTFVRASPIRAEVSFVLIVPHQPLASLEETRRRKLDVGQNLGKATDVESPGRLEDSRSLLYPSQRPLDVCCLRLEAIPFRLLDVVRRVGKDQVNRLVLQ